MSPKFFVPSTFLKVVAANSLTWSAWEFLDALASLKTMLDIKWLRNSCFQDFKITEYYIVLQSVTECSRVLQSVTVCYRVLQSVTDCYRVFQSITKYYNYKSSASTWTNFWACFYQKHLYATNMGCLFAQIIFTLTHISRWLCPRSYVSP